MQPAESYQISARVAVRRGDVVRFTSGGPCWTDASGDAHRMTISGCWQITGIQTKGKRIWLDVVEVDQVLGHGARRLVFVAGRAYRSILDGLLWRPYRVRKINQRKGNRSGQKKAGKTGCDAHLSQQRQKRGQAGRRGAAQ